jgi:hypothetical protein
MGSALLPSLLIQGASGVGGADGMLAHCFASVLDFPTADPERMK